MENDKVLALLDEFLRLDKEAREPVMQGCGKQYTRKDMGGVSPWHCTQMYPCKDCAPGVAASKVAHRSVLRWRAKTLELLHKARAAK